MDQSIREVDPGELRLPPSRKSGADPWKLHQQIREFGPQQAGAAFPRGSVGTSCFPWFHCRPSEGLRRKATQSVEDGIPTRERGNEFSFLGFRVGRGVSGAGRRRGASRTAFPRGSVGTRGWEALVCVARCVVLRRGVCYPEICS